jgi:hypothetical protein
MLLSGCGKIAGGGRSKMRSGEIMAGGRGEIPFRPIFKYLFPPLMQIRGEC